MNSQTADLPITTTNIFNIFQWDASDSLAQRSVHQWFEWIGVPINAKSRTLSSIQLTYRDLGDATQGGKDAQARFCSHLRTSS